MSNYRNMFTFEEGIDLDLMKRRLTHNGKRIYIKTLTPDYAIVSYDKEHCVKMFKVEVDSLVKI
tara:strand:- start:29 stop:220 length:192 start_codon:yes stop_codon:yes gene_type:complete